MCDVLRLMLTGEVSDFPTFLFSFCDVLLDVFFEVAHCIVAVMSADFDKHIRCRVDVHAWDPFPRPAARQNPLLRRSEMSCLIFLGMASYYHNVIIKSGFFEKNCVHCLIFAERST